MRASARLEARLSAAWASAQSTGGALSGGAGECASDECSAAATGRLYGEVLDGRWMHVGTPEGVHAAQEVLASGLSN